MHDPQSRRLSSRVKVSWPAHMTFGRSSRAIVEVQNLSSTGARMIVAPTGRAPGEVEGLVPGACFSVMLFPRDHAFFSTSCSIKWIRTATDGGIELGVNFLEPIPEDELRAMLATG